MTVCVSVAVNDCVVFAADSASTLVNANPQTGESQVLNVYQHGDKLFNLYKGLPISAVTCGMGNIGSASIATLAKELRRRMKGEDSTWKLDPKSYRIGDVVEKAKLLLYDEFYSAVQPPTPVPHAFEFWVGGYSADFDAGHEVWKISIINGACKVDQLSAGGSSGLFAGGQPGPINRLIAGFDHALIDHLIGAGLTASDAQALVNYLHAKLSAPLVWPTMPVRDAIDLAEFLVETTKRYFRFLPGADVVGGETDIAVVTKYEGFKWIRRKHFYPAALNPLETDHA